MNWLYAVGSLLVVGALNYFRNVPSAVARTAAKTVPFYDTNNIQTPQNATGATQASPPKIVSETLLPNASPASHTNFRLAPRGALPIGRFVGLPGRLVTPITYTPAPAINPPIGEEQRLAWATATPAGSPVFGRQLLR